MREMLLLLLKFVGAGMLGGAIFGTIAYFGRSGSSSRLYDSTLIAMLPVAFVIICAGPMTWKI
jgi:hypothetical protein